MITKVGAVIIAECLSSIKKIDYIMISSETHMNETTELADFISYDLIAVKDTRVTKDITSGKVILLFSTYENASSLKTRNIKTVGLVCGSEIVALEPAKKTISSSDILNQDYYLPLKIS